jgi:FMNH2-dependent dimethyl sulfone monooxygenase
MSVAVDRTIVDHTVDRSTTRPLAGPNRLKLGVFAPNLSAGASSISLAPGPPVMGNWGEAQAIAQAADQAGFEVVVPIARWMGHGGESRFWQRSFETMTWGAALAATTNDIFVMTTCHVPMVHPVLAAKMGATLDHVSGGRWGLNLVAGWSKPEFDLFGVEFAEHSDRYRLSEEWIQIVKRLWTEEEPFDFDGDFFHLKGAISDPKPVQAPYPLIMNAGQSPPGLALAGKHSDMAYIGLAGDTDIPGSVQRVREAASLHGREVAVWALAHIVSADTDEAAQAQVESYAIENGDVETAMRYAASLMRTDTASQAAFRADSDLVRNLMISQGNYSIVGSAESVAQRLVELSQAGIDGLAVAFFDYVDGIARFEADVMPLLVDANVRVA